MDGQYRQHPRIDVGFAAARVGGGDGVKGVVSDGKDVRSQRGAHVLRATWKGAKLGEDSANVGDGVGGEQRLYARAYLSCWLVDNHMAYRSDQPRSACGEQRGGGVGVV